MNAYRCDACKKVFLLPLDAETERHEGIPGQLYLYKERGFADVIDLCKDCSEKVVNLINLIGVGKGETN